jgi:hypothetical protein
MLEVLVALDVAQRHMKDQVEMDVPTGAKVRRAHRKHRSPSRAAFVLAMRVLGKAQTIHRSGEGWNRRARGAPVGDHAQAAAQDFYDSPEAATE